jgi:uncharacterized protein YbjT (DUF2867 family)
MIVVTAPTGAIGAAVVDQLLAAGAPVRVVVRDPARLAPGVADRTEVVRGSHGDPAVVAEAFTGAEAVFWLVPPDPRAATLDEAFAGFTRPAAEALAAQGVGRVVGVSALGRGTAVAGRAGYATAAFAADDLIAATGRPFRALTCASFMNNILRQAATIRTQGVYHGTYRPDRPLPLVATGDIAAVAARLLRDDSWLGVGEVPLLGPADLSQNDLAAIMTDVLGRPVRYRETTPDAAVRAAVGQGTSEAMARGRVELSLAKNDGLDAAARRAPEYATPTTFRRWCVDVLKPAVA